MAKRKVPTKNIEPIVVDVRRPGFNYSRLRKTALNLARVPQKPFHSKKPARIFWGATVLVLVLFVLALGIITLNLGSVKRGLTQKSEDIFNNFSASLEALKNFRPDSAVASLTENNKELSSLNNFLLGSYSDTLIGVAGKFIPFLRDAGGFIGQVTNLNLEFLNLSSALSDLQINGFRYLESDGVSLVKRLTEVRDLTESITKRIETLRNTTANLKNTASFFDRIDDTLEKNYLNYSAELYSWDKFLNALLALLNSEKERHILLLFQNPAELRPGGGFVGSYADVTLSGGEMKQIDVRDIYDPDGQFDLKVVPPQPLQDLTHDWGARDANWFFDFPTSAKTVVSFLEQSKMYSEKNITFDGVIALNINVLKNILDLIGSIDLPDYNFTITSGNFLNEIQREVEAGKDKAAGYPKRILQILTPQIIERLNSLSEEEAVKLMDSLKENVIRKDIMFYAKDADLAGFFAVGELDGAVYNLPSGFWGNYLAVVNANVAGGKSDVFVRQDITANINLDTDGGIFTDLIVARTHTGDTEKDVWWRATNKDFIQIFTNDNASLSSLKGADGRAMPKNSDYGSYAVNPDLANIENTMLYLPNYNAWSMDAFGKKVFGAWLYTPAGQTKTLNLRYEITPSGRFSPGEGSFYQFVFDRQSGTAEETLKLAISAPLGFFWQESGAPVFVYEKSDLPGRLVLNLTLEKSE